MTELPPQPAPVDPAGPADPPPKAATGSTVPPGGWGYGPAPGRSGLPFRHELIRPREGRYLAGVCAAIGRATNTDPILWRVLLAVLGFFGGVGIVAYLSAWLLIPAEGDSASPVESMLGRGRSSMSPVTVIALSVLVAVSFGFLVSDAFRAVLLGTTVLIGAALLLNRQPTANAADPPQTPPAGPPAPPTVGATTGAEPPGGPGPVTVPAATGPVEPAGYRPPFAPHGPYASPPGPPPPGPGQPTRLLPPLPPIPDRSPLGAVTFSLVLVVIGLVAVVDLTDALPVTVSAYFAAALATIALGLLVGTWFGRARWLIALGLVAVLGLGVSALVESYDRVRTTGGTVSWTPISYDELADRYEHRFGDATLDLRQVDLAAHETSVTADISFGKLVVIVPAEVDVTTRATIRAGNATVFGSQWSGFNGPVREMTDPGPDGAGGGVLRLQLHVTAGEAEVIR